jgi:hyperosmotically inducible periplasmic protein
MNRPIFRTALAGSVLAMSLTFTPTVKAQQQGQQQQGQQQRQQEGQRQEGQRRALPDNVIQSVVNHRLIDRGILDEGEGNVKVQVQNGNVTLEGTVASAYHRRQAEIAARGVDGVRQVENRLDVRGATDVAPQDVANRVASAIRGSVYFDLFDWVEGNVQDGIVTLRGWVREPWRKNEYAELARGVAGVREVRNEIETLPVSSFDDQLRVNVARAIYGHPTFTRHANRAMPPIHIVVNNGEVWLKGQVGSELERTQAGMLARQTQAFQVHNDLQVEGRRDEARARE